ncbi:hypothetical protein SCUCBS95973_004098 [Sporothrix curviconia]|uniref:Zn(2)-C6 fungal-type domain-containing protein n=1 Tax=Sporothrix curviconia TaxID=1260050 RepID=A0ABP0BKV4_9PEZI
MTRNRRRTGVALTLNQNASPSLPDDNDEPDRMGRKRRRTVQACEECRDRKRKCDGVRPVCSSCSRRPGRCVWNDHRNTKGNKYVEGLRSRIRELEARDHAATGAQQRGQLASGVTVGTESTAGIASHANQALAEGNRPAPSPPAPGPPVASLLSPSPSQASLVPHLVEAAATQQPALAAVHHPTTASGHLDGAEADSDTDPSDDDDSTIAVGSSRYVDGLDAMGVVHSAADGAPGRRRRPSEYFGPSSTVSLLGDAFSAINAMHKKAPWHGSSPSGSWGVAAGDCGPLEGRVDKQLTPSPSRDGSNEAKARAVSSGLGYTVPTRPEADQLVDGYRTWVHSLYPYVHMPSFLARYRAVWESTTSAKGRQTDRPSTPASTNYYEGMSEKLFHCMLNLVFAMGALFSPSVAFQDRSSVSGTFFARGKALVDLDELACGSPALVQVLLLMGQYLQSTDAASSCWNIVGLTIHVCQGIGLHQEPECCRGDVCTGGHHSQLEREMRRRTWMCSVILDR